MQEHERRQVIADEAAREERYNAALESRRARFHQLRRDQTRNTFTTPSADSMPTNGEFIGRVALDGPHPDLDGGAEFYIATVRLPDAEFPIFSWSSSVASVLYRHSGSRHSLSDHVGLTRRFSHRAGRLVDFEDERAAGARREVAFAGQELKVPAAPKAHRPTPRPEVQATETAVTQPGSDSGFPREAPKLPERPPRNKPVPGPPILAGRLLQQELAAPKGAAMGSVLATLQTDQYELITKPATTHQIIQGHPGTGKTIIGTHRAAYLLRSPESEGEKPLEGRVLILGPTPEYVEHVSEAIRRLVDDPDRFQVAAISTFLDDMAGRTVSAEPTDSESWAEVSDELTELVDLAHKRALDECGPGERPRATDVYAELRWLLESPPDTGLDAVWVPFLRGLPDHYADALRLRSTLYRGLLAYIAVRTEFREQYAHVIVDEAQDLHPIDWLVLGRLGNRGGWTILGDLNQRRTDHTWADWDQVAQVLAIENEDGSAPVRVLARGYRSTAPIIRFANQLLPAKDRELFSLQEVGERPRVIRARKSADLGDEIEAAAQALLEQVGDGSVAIITVDPIVVGRLLARKGWRSHSRRNHIWRYREQSLKVMSPDRTRGLEFDGVVLVEPADFPQNFGRHGVLFTALTRANRYLTVVHHRALPGGLKPLR